MDFKISKILAKDLLQGRSDYVKDGNLIFNRIVIVSSDAHNCHVNFYYDNCLLASAECNGRPGPYSTFDFDLQEGSMKIHFENESVCDWPDSYDKLRQAAMEVIKEIEAKEKEHKSEQ